MQTAFSTVRVAGPPAACQPPPRVRAPRLELEWINDFEATGLGLHNIMLRVFAFNERGSHASTWAGFQIIGRRHQAQRVGNRAYDIISMDCLASEF